jgi:hypothetical protein
MRNWNAPFHPRASLREQPFSSAPDRQKNSKDFFRTNLRLPRNGVQELVDNGLSGFLIGVLADESTESIGASADG